MGSRCWVPRCCTQSTNLGHAQSIVILARSIGAGLIGAARDVVDADGEGTDWEEILYLNTAISSQYLNYTKALFLCFHS
jgi:hypothetical protein